LISDTPEDIRNEELAREFILNISDKDFSESFVAEQHSGIMEGNAKEKEFWHDLVEKKIGTHLEKTGKLAELKDNLARYRNSAVTRGLSLTCSSAFV